MRTRNGTKGRRGGFQDYPERLACPHARLRKRKTLFHASMQVTRLEEWCVEGETAEEARRLLESGEGHRCGLGECVDVAFAQLLE